MKSREKSAKALKTISEVAKILDLPQHVLRFWETKFTKIQPLKRGGGRRYYRPEDLVLLREIQHLLHEDGYTIKGVQTLLKKSYNNKTNSAPLKLSKNEKADNNDSRSIKLKKIILELKELNKLLKN